MPALRELMRKYLADGKIDGHEVEALCDLIYADDVIDRQEAEFLVELHRRVERISPGFEKFVYQAIKRHVLTDGVIDAEEVAWLRRVLFADGKVTTRETKLIRELRGEAEKACPEFETLYEDVLAAGRRS